MAWEPDLSSWTDLLHSSIKLLEQATPSAQFPPLQRDLDPLESLSKNIKAETLRIKAPHSPYDGDMSSAKATLESDTHVSFASKLAKFRNPGLGELQPHEKHNDHSVMDQEKKLVEDGCMYCLTLTKRRERKAGIGFWHASSKPKYIFDEETKKLVGETRTLVYYTGTPDHGSSTSTCLNGKTNWIMHEYTLVNAERSINQSKVMVGDVYRKMHRSTPVSRGPSSSALHLQACTSSGDKHHQHPKLE
ncbi:hypothetical protein Sjap_025786 [Stephania japonica]|uniref:NAC domain-containing protein n=1 Tax=Stephania japonica TaxID=461633 RepID=A0AAP0E295_9MAGN